MKHRIDPKSLKNGALESNCFRREASVQPLDEGAFLNYLALAI